jgi:hypothetical protein
MCVFAYIMPLTLLTECALLLVLLPVVLPSGAAGDAAAAGGAAGDAAGVAAGGAALTAVLPVTPLLVMLLPVPLLVVLPVMPLLLAVLPVMLPVPLLVALPVPLAAMLASSPATPPAASQKQGSFFGLSSCRFQLLHATCAVPARSTPPHRATNKAAAAAGTAVVSKAVMRSAQAKRIAGHGRPHYDRQPVASCRRARAQPHYYLATHGQWSASSR